MQYQALAVAVAMLAPMLASAAPKIRRQAGSLTTWTTQIVPLVIVGEGWSQKFVLQNVDDRWNSSAEITFFTHDGQPFRVELRGIGTVSSHRFTIQQGRSLVIELVPKFTAQQLGWAMIDQYTTGPVGSDDFSGIGDLFGQVVFRKQSPGLPDFMCSIVLGGQSYERTSTYFDNTNGNYTGMGILTSYDFNSTTTVALRVTVRDISGQVVSQKTIQRRQRTLYWMNLAADFPETSGRVGTFEVEAVDRYSTSLTAFSLQFAGNGAFTVVTPFEY